MLTELRSESALIQKEHADHRFLSTAWTLFIVRGALLMCLMVIFAPVISDLFAQPGASPLLRIGALNFLLLSIPQVHLALLNREMNYRGAVLINIFREIVGISTSIFLALWLQNAWALLIGFLLSNFVVSIGIWIVHPFRPTFVMDPGSLKYLWRFGNPLYFEGLLTYLITRGDDFVVAKLQTLEKFGQYGVIFSITEMATRGISQVISSVAFPAYSVMAREGRELVEGFDEIWRISVLIILLTTGIVVAFPQGIVNLLLGEQWADAAETFALLMVAQGLRAFAASIGTVILASGATRYLFKIKIGEFLVFAMLVYPMVTYWGIFGAAATLVIVYAYSIIGHLYCAEKITPILHSFMAGLLEPLCLFIGLLILFRYVRSLNPLPVIVEILLYLVAWAVYLTARQRAIIGKIAAILFSREKTA